MLLESPVFELRSHIYQGRSLMPADDSGLSDPFVRVLFAGHTIQTTVKQQTVNPLWDECLILPIVKLYGDPESIKESPPDIIVQIYDEDLDVCVPAIFQALNVLGHCRVNRSSSDSSSVVLASSWRAIVTLSQTFLRRSIGSRFTCRIIELARSSQRSSSYT